MDMPKEKRNIAASDIPKEAVLKTCEFANAIFVEDAVFAEKTFDCFADFSNSEFRGEVDFSKTVFLKGVSFEGAKFYCNGKDVLFEDAIFLPSENNIDFSNAHFGKSYHLELDGWRVGFQLEISGNKEIRIYNLIRFQQEEGKPTATETLPDIKIENIAERLKSWNMEAHAKAIAQAFEIFRDNPKTVSFARCRFGDIDFPELNEEELDNIKTKINHQFEREYNKTLRDELKNFLQIFEAFYAKETNYSIAEKQKRLCNLVYSTEEKKRNPEEAKTLFAVAQILSRALDRERLLPLIRVEAKDVDFSITFFLIKVR